jgi:hypothetical protein
LRREQSIPRRGNSSSNQPEEWNFFYAVISWRIRTVYDDNAKDIDDDLSDKVSATIYKVEEDGQCRKGKVLKGVYNPGD